MKNGDIGEKDREKVLERGKRVHMKETEKERDTKRVNERERGRER